MQGTYCLIISVPTEVTVTTTARGHLEFKKGYWLYVGSAQGSGSTNLSNRLNRHFRQKKKIHWHIDHLLTTKAHPVEAIWAESPGEFECLIAQRLASLKEFSWGPNRFGSSDCKKSCISHVLFYEGRGFPIEQIENVFQILNLKPLRYSENQPTTQ